MRLIRSIILNLAAAAFCTLVFYASIAAQSIDPNFPTAVTTNEIDGTIKARDIGDARLTSYFYTFDGGQGDVFVNVVTRNFTGDIDVFAAEGLRPLTKMVIFADSGAGETGRLIYLRKPERLILRVEGRSPNDDPATFQIKFAGSFIALAAQKPEGTPPTAQTEVNAESGIRVNSVGTIIEVIPKPQPPKKAEPVNKETVATAVKDKRTKQANPPAENPLPRKAAETAKETAAPISELPKKAVKESVPTANASAKKASPPVSGLPSTVFRHPAKRKGISVAKKPPARTPKPPAMPDEKTADPLSNIHLTIQLKDGKMIERPMSEVLKFGVDNGVLTVIAKDGRIVKYSIFDVAKVTIE